MRGEPLARKECITPVGVLPGRGESESSDVFYFGTPADNILKQTRRKSTLYRLEGFCLELARERNRYVDSAHEERERGCIVNGPNQQIQRALGSVDRYRKSPIGNRESPYGLLIDGARREPEVAVQMLNGCFGPSLARETHCSQRLLPASHIHSVASCVTCFQMANNTAVNLMRKLLKDVGW